MRGEIRRALCQTRVDPYGRPCPSVDRRQTTLRLVIKPFLTLMTKRTSFVETRILVIKVCQVFLATAHCEAQLEWHIKP